MQTSYRRKKRAGFSWHRLTQPWSMCTYANPTQDTRAITQYLLLILSR